MNKRKIPFKKILAGTAVHLYMIFIVLIILIPVFWMVTSTFYNTRALSAIPLIPDFSKFTLKKYDGCLHLNKYHKFWFFQALFIHY